MGLKSIFIAIVAVFAIGMGAWLSYQLAVPPAVPRTATVLPATAGLPDFALSDQHGNRISRDAFVGRWSLVFFGFTHCPDICPLTLQVLANARQKLGDAGHIPLPQIVLVSVDPERDTPEILGEYLDYFGNDILGLSGNIEELRKLTSALGIFFEKSFTDDGDYSMNHSAVVLVFNPRAEFHALFSAPHVVDNFIHDLPLIMSGS